MKVEREEQRKINFKAKSEMKMWNMITKKGRKMEKNLQKLKKDVKHENCEEVEKIDIVIHQYLCEVTWSHAQRVCRALQKMSASKAKGKLFKRYHHHLLSL